MTPQRRTALGSVVAAAVLIGVKLTAGIGSGSLGLVTEALHSGTDLVAALLTFFALGVAGRPADEAHQFGHGKAEHLAALAEAAILAAVSVGVAALAVARLTGRIDTEVDAVWWAFAAAGLVVVIDLARAAVSLRGARRYESPALLANALHFGSDLVGTLAVLGGLAAARAGWPAGDSIAALFVAGLVLLAAGRLMRTNVDVLMDRSPVAAEEAARRAIAGVDPAVDLRRLRMRQAAGRHFADVVIGVSPGAAIGQGHAAADRVEDAIHAVLPGSDVVVHVEPSEDAVLRERAHAAALGVPRVREVHNLSVLRVGGRTEISLHLKLPGDLTLEEAHGVAEAVEEAIREALPEVRDVHTHIEPLGEEGVGREVDADAEAVTRIVRETTGRPPRALRFLHTDGGLVAHLTLGMDSAETLAAAHERASAVEQRIHDTLPEIADVVVHTEPGPEGPVRAADQWKGSGGTGRFPQQS
jgi:cation diffusion facilitator family transporter